MGSLRKTGAVLCVAGALTVSGCEGDTNGDSGAIIGGIAGAVAGSFFGDGVGRAFATAAGSIAGAVIGREIARALNDEEQKRAATASKRALEEPRYTNRGEEAPVRWVSPERPDTRGETKVVEREVVAGRECVKKRDTAYVQGKEIIDYKTVCRGEDGSWTEVA